MQYKDKVAQSLLKMHTRKIHIHKDKSHEVDF